MNQHISISSFHGLRVHFCRTRRKNPNKKRPSPESGRKTLCALARYHPMLMSSHAREKLVDLRGLEPLTFCMPCRRAPSCATGPRMRIAHPLCDAVTGVLPVPARQMLHRGGIHGRVRSCGVVLHQPTTLCGETDVLLPRNHHLRLLHYSTTTPRKLQGAIWRMMKPTIAMPLTAAGVST
jgi:hypothetical protein